MKKVIKKPTHSILLLRKTNFTLAKNKRRQKKRRRRRKKKVDAMLDNLKCLDVGERFPE